MALSSYFRTTEIIINPTFTTAAQDWSVEIINPGPISSGQFQFSVVSPNGALRPTITSVEPSEPLGSNISQPLKIHGTDFAPGATVTLRDLSTGEAPLTNRPIGSSGPTQIVINPTFPALAHDWSVEVINPSGIASGQFTFSVAPPPTSGGFYLSFPLQGHGPNEKLINSVFDHHIPTSLGTSGTVCPDLPGNHCTWYYGSVAHDQTVTAFTGEEGVASAGTKVPNGPSDKTAPLSYRDPNGHLFSLDGAYNDSGYYLSYDGHAGIDFQAVETTQIVAPAEGEVCAPSYRPSAKNRKCTLSILDPADGQGCTYQVPDDDVYGPNVCDLNPLVIDHGDGYRTWILHAERNQYFHKRGHVGRGDPIARAGHEGVGAGNAHLHFEIRKQAVGGAWIPVDPYGWQPLDPQKIDPYTRAPCDPNTGNNCKPLWGSGSAANSISGKVTDLSGNAISGVPVALTGTAPSGAALTSDAMRNGAAATQPTTAAPLGFTITDGDGNYSFPDLISGGDYTVAITENNSVETLQEQAVSNLDGNQTVNFSAGSSAIPIAIRSSPQSQVVTSGNDVALTVDASGPAPLSFQWQLNGADIPGATETLLLLNNIRVDQQGDYSVTVGHAGEFVRSATASVAVKPALAETCSGDCDGNGAVTIDEILTMVNIALGNTTITACDTGDANQDKEITVDEILTAVNNALNGCGSASTPTPTATPVPTVTNAPSLTPTDTQTTTPTETPTPTRVIDPTDTATVTPSGTPTNTQTTTLTETPTPTRVIDPTDTATVTPSVTPSNTPTLTPSPSPSATASASASASPSPSPESAEATVNYLIVGGGGTGGAYAKFAGGGGAGGMLTGTTTVTAGTPYAIAIGGSDQDSSAFSLTGTAGGRGADGGAGNGSNGGSGGGASSNGSANTGGTGGQGHDGGSSPSNNLGGAGGGGQGITGTNASTTNGAAGGNGTASSISGSSVTYAGGGGGGAQKTSSSGGSGGTGGGGAGGTGSGGAGNGHAGTANTGGGGGGAGGENIGGSGGVGGAGGSGIVIISAPSGIVVSATGGTHTQVGGNDIWTFTSSGTWVPTLGGLPSLTPSPSATGSVFPSASPTPSPQNVEATVDYLIVGGGGYGGSTLNGSVYGAGGGGGGGVLFGPFTVTSLNYPIVVGAASEESSAFGIVAYGGGAGGDELHNGHAGGSGGGAGSAGADSGAPSRNGGVAAYGEQGHNGGGSAGRYYGAGGGGGAGSAGGAGASGGGPGNGGDGLLSSISGAPVYYGGGGGVVEKASMGPVALVEVEMEVHLASERWARRIRGVEVAGLGGATTQGFLAVLVSS